jgi:hypothetical protein
MMMPGASTYRSREGYLAAELEQGSPTRDPATLRYNILISYFVLIGWNMCVTKFVPSDHAMVWKSSFPANTVHFFLYHASKAFVAGSSSRLLVEMVARRTLKGVRMRRVDPPYAGLIKD